MIKGFESLQKRDENIMICGFYKSPSRKRGEKLCDAYLL